MWNLCVFGQPKTQKMQSKQDHVCCKNHSWFNKSNCILWMINTKNICRWWIEEKARKKKDRHVRSFEILTCYSLLKIIKIINNSIYLHQEYNKFIIFFENDIRLWVGHRVIQNSNIFFEILIVKHLSFVTVHNQFLMEERDNTFRGVCT